MKTTLEYPVVTARRLLGRGERGVKSVLFWGGWHALALPFSPKKIFQKKLFAFLN
jgi:hypothetical protein